MAVTCPACKVKRYVPMRIVRQQLAKPNYSGTCKPCWLTQPKSRTMRSPRNPTGRRVAASGYVLLSKNAIQDADLDMFDQMRGSAGSVGEHRWIMARHLGRALTTYELVDHMDGNKANNHLGNLRLYVRGKQQPGSAPGYGTYYHEWQMALLRISELEAR